MEQMYGVVSEEEVAEEIFHALVDLIGPERVQIFVNHLMNGFVSLLAQDQEAEKDFLNKLEYIKKHAEVQQEKELVDNFKEMQKRQREDPETFAVIADRISESVTRTIEKGDENDSREQQE